MDDEILLCYCLNELLLLNSISLLKMLSTLEISPRNDVTMTKQLLQWRCNKSAFVHSLMLLLFLYCRFKAFRKLKRRYIFYRQLKRGGR